MKNENDLKIIIGKSTNGKDVYFDIAKNSSLIITGMKGYGKTTLLKNIISSLSANNNALLFIAYTDKTQFKEFLKLKNLLSPLSDNKKVGLKLKWAREEIERRFDIISEAKANDFYSYNLIAKNKLKNIILVIDDLPAELFETAKMRKLFIELIWYARAAGICLIFSIDDEIFRTSKIMDVNVNIFAKLSFRLKSTKYSQNFLYESGAEKLRKPGEALFTDGVKIKIRKIRTQN